MVERPSYRCPLCSYSTTNATNLTCHSRKHSMAQPFSCPHCDQTYASLSGLRCHILRSGLHPDRCLYHCPWCQDFATNARTAMSRHLYEQHPKIMPRDRPCIDVNEVLGIYRPEDDVTPTAAAATSPNASAPRAAAEPSRVRLGVRIAPRDRQKALKSSRETAAKLGERSDLEAERVTCKNYKSCKVRDQIVHAGIGLWTKGNLAKFL